VVVEDAGTGLVAELELVFEAALEPDLIGCGIEPDVAFTAAGAAGAGKP
jgi:hypothetical protein